MNFYSKFAMDFVEIFDWPSFFTEKIFVSVCTLKLLECSFATKIIKLETRTYFYHLSLPILFHFHYNNFKNLNINVIFVSIYPWHSFCIQFFTLSSKTLFSRFGDVVHLDSFSFFQIFGWLWSWRFSLYFFPFELFLDDSTGIFARGEITTAVASICWIK